jgi:hypothetical protein
VCFCVCVCVCVWCDDDAKHYCCTASGIIWLVAAQPRSPCSCPGCQHRRSKQSLAGVRRAPNSNQAGSNCANARAGCGRPSSIHAHRLSHKCNGFEWTRPCPSQRSPAPPHQPPSALCTMLSAPTHTITGAWAPHLTKPPASLKLRYPSQTLQCLRSFLPILCSGDLRTNAGQIEESRCGEKCDGGGWTVLPQACARALTGVTTALRSRCARLSRVKFGSGPGLAWSRMTRRLAGQGHRSDLAGRPAGLSS